MRRQFCVPTPTGPNLTVSPRSGRRRVQHARLTPESVQPERHRQYSQAVRRQEAGQLPVGPVQREGLSAVDLAAFRPFPYRRPSSHPTPEPEPEQRGLVCLPATPALRYWLVSLRRWPEPQVMEPAAAARHRMKRRAPASRPNRKSPGRKPATDLSARRRPVLDLRPLTGRDRPQHWPQRTPVIRHSTDRSPHSRRRTRARLGRWVRTE